MAPIPAVCPFDRFDRCRIVHVTQAEHFLDHGTATVERMADGRRILSAWWDEYRRNRPIPGTGWWAGTE